jgi:hypothetical protein
MTTMTKAPHDLNGWLVSSVPFNLRVVAATKIIHQNDRLLATLYRRWSRGHSPGSVATAAWLATSSATQQPSLRSFVSP